MATPSLAMERETVRRRCAEARESMELTSRMLLLQEGAKPISLDPLGGAAESYAKARNSIVASTKSLAISIKDLTALLGQPSDPAHYPAVCQAIQSIGEQVVMVTEAASQAAYLSAMTVDTASKPCVPGAVDGYAFSKAKQMIQFAYDRFRVESGPMSTEGILQASRTFADSLATLTKGCRAAAAMEGEEGEGGGVSEVDRAQFSACVQSLQGTTAAFLTSLKLFSSTSSLEDRRRCLVFGRAVLEAVNSVVTFASLPQFAGKPAELSPRGAGLQTEIMGGAMAVVSSSVQLLNSTEAVMEGGSGNAPMGWQKLVSCSKAVAEATRLLCSSLKEHDPSTPRSRSPDSSTHFR